MAAARKRSKELDEQANIDFDFACYNLTYVDGDFYDEQGDRIARRQMKFVLEWLKDRNGTQAMIRAGYSPNGANVMAVKFLRLPAVRRFIKERDRRIMLDAELDEAWVLKKLKENVLRAIEIDDLSSINRSLELLGKHIGMFVDKSKIEIAFEHIERVERRIIDPNAELIEYQVDDKRRDN